MKSFNQVMLIGNLAADPEMRQTKNSKTVVNFPLAIDRKEGADFHRIVAWNKLAEICDQYLVKGSAVCVVGHLVNSSFDDKEGNTHYRTEIYADEIKILSWKKPVEGQSIEAEGAAV